MSFIMLEGARSSSAFFSNRILPLVASVRIAVGASPSNPPSSFLAPWTLWLAAWSMPAQPTATATIAAANRIDARPVVATEGRHGRILDAIGEALRAAFSQLQVT